MKRKKKRRRRRGRGNNEKRDGESFKCLKVLVEVRLRNDVRGSYSGDGCITQ